MKKVLLIVAAMGILSTVSYAAGPVSFGLQATAANINIDGPLKEIYGFGYGGGAHLDINLPVLFAIRLQGDYTTFGPDEAKYRAELVRAAATLGFQTNPSDFSIDGGRINILAFHANAKMSPLPLPILSPYVTGGGGIARLSASDANIKYTGNQPLTGGTVSGAPAETKASANLGVGVDLNLIALKLYLEARYTWVFTSGSTSTYIPVSLGVTF